MVKVNWTREAIENIHELREHFEPRSLRYAEQLTDQIFEKAEILIQFPQIGRVVPEIDNPAIRELIYKSYRIIYTILTEDKIDILAVHNGLRPLSDISIFD
ncbi:MAG: type II toxin-antitoxin system RelE/ParE family toxin [Imperialibacter sp.]|uniref:type II toxin-antitoxin system RelE/ParE family toxin n=1 Tax=Imperialibacter sp. TaxID=2038411 RepID=UPI003A8B8CE1